MSTDDVGNVTPLQHLEQQMVIMNEKELIFNNRSLKKHIKELSAENENMYDMLYIIEIQSNNLDQYSRRSNTEIRNIPENITQGNLENYVLKVMVSIGINLQSYDLVAVPR